MAGFCREEGLAVVTGAGVVVEVGPVGIVGNVGSVRLDGGGVVRAGPGPALNGSLQAVRALLTE